MLLRSVGDGAEGLLMEGVMLRGGTLWRCGCA